MPADFAASSIPNRRQVPEMYEVLEVALADTPRLFQYHQAGVYGAQFNLKGFAYPWLVSSRKWSKGDRVLDVGAGYSELPVHLAEAFGCESWVVDDFGVASGEPFWKRGREPQEHIRARPQVNYVLERLGDPARSSLPPDSFDCIYSLSTLEHVPRTSIVAVWQHMERLLRPGGEMLHAVDLGLPVKSGLPSVLKALAIDTLFPLMPSSARLGFVYHTPHAYARFVVQSILKSPMRHDRLLNVTRLLLDPEVVSESMENTYNRIIKDGMTGVRHVKKGTLLLRLRKAA